MKNQKWYFLTNNKHFYYISSTNELCSLEIPWGLANDNSIIRYYHEKGTKSQMFILKMFK